MVMHYRIFSVSLSTEILLQEQFGDYGLIKIIKYTMKQSSPQI